MVARSVADDWQYRYKYRPVLLETFVEKCRFTGTCYKAANWQRVGETKGRGKLEPSGKISVPIKDIWLYPVLDDISKTLRKGYTEVIDADLSKYFDTIPHAKLLAVVAERIADGGILHLIKQWLKAPVVEKGEDGKDRTSGGKGNRRGTPQGGVISPLLANLYLHLLDRIWERHGLAQKYGARLVRYADDMVLLCAKGTAKPLAMLKIGSGLH